MTNDFIPSREDFIELGKVVCALIAQAEAEDESAVVGWIVQVTDPETDQSTMFGPWVGTDQGRLMASLWADNFLAQFEELDPSGPSLHTEVFPLIFPDRITHDADFG